MPQLQNSASSSRRRPSNSPRKTFSQKRRNTSSPENGPASPITTNKTRRLSPRKKSPTKQLSNKSSDRIHPVYTLEELKAIPKKLRPYFVDRAFITIGYRGALGGMTFEQCTESLLGYLHNESANVFSSLLPGLYFTAQLVLILLGTSNPDVLQTWQSVAF